jgi:peptide deformylase
MHNGPNTRNIKYNAKKFPGTDISYTQRAANAEQAEGVYFNQPVLPYPFSFPATADEKKEVKTIANDMLKAIEATGVGLTHNQMLPREDVTNAYAIFVINGKNFGTEESKAYINPIIVGFDPKQVDFFHGCLSAIDVDRARVATYETILIAFFSEELELTVEKLTGFEAIVAQHEFNHLSTSTTYVDAVNYALTGDQYKQAEGVYIDQNVLKESGQGSQILDHKEGAPSLISTEILVRCKQFLNYSKQYRDAVDAYLLENRGDVLLYENLNSTLPDKTEQTYYPRNCYPNVENLKNNQSSGSSSILGV